MYIQRLYTELEVNLKVMNRTINENTTEQQLKTETLIEGLGCAGLSWTGQVRGWEGQDLLGLD